MLTGKAKLWLIGGLSAALLLALWQWRSEIQSAAQWAVGFDQVVEANRSLEQELDALRADHRREQERAARHAAAIEGLQREAERATSERRALERTDEEYAEWADDCLPRATRERLRIPANGCD